MVLVKNAHVKRKSVVVPSNPLKADPTRTATLRRRFVSDMRVRFRILKGLIIDLVITDDAFGLKRRVNDPFSNNQEQDDVRKIVNQNRIRVDSDSSYDVSNSHKKTDETVHETIREVFNTHFRFQSDPDKLASFTAWLSTQIDGVVMQGATRQAVEDAWWTKYVEEGYRKGQGRAFDDIRNPALASGSNQLSFFQGTKDEFLRQSFGRPESIEKVKLLASRVFTDLKGVNDVMASQMTRVLADGLVRGENPHTIARELNNRIDTIGRTRSTTIARTEIIRAHAEGQLDALEQMGVTEVGVMVEWSTAGDDRVCARCQPMDGVVLKIKEARGLIPLHPNCRCAHIPANVGEDKSDQKRSKTEIDESINKSIKAFKPKRTKRTIAQQKALTPFRGKTIAKKRPKEQI